MFLLCLVLYLPYQSHQTNIFLKYNACHFNQLGMVIINAEKPTKILFDQIKIFL